MKLELGVAQLVSEGTSEAQAVSGKIQAIRADLKANFKERDALVDAVLVGLLSGKNVFVGGPPGTGKSALVNALSRAIGGKYFYTMMGKTSTPEDIFGPTDIAALRDSRFRRNTKGYLPDADIAFIDEVFKASSAVLNSTLNILNERTYKNGDELMKTPLMFAVGASNEIPEAEELAALYDRFTIRVWVEYIQSEDLMMELLKADDLDSITLPSISMQEIVLAQNAAKSVLLGDDMLKLMLELKRSLLANGVEISDRKWKQATKVVAAFAYLNGHTKVEIEDLEFLQHMLWDDPNDFKTIRRMVNKVVNPLADEMNQAVDAVRSILKELEAGSIMSADAATKINTGIKRLLKLGDPATNPKLKEALDTCRKVQLHVSREYLGLE